MDTLEQQYGGHFSEAQKKKVLGYYGLFIPSVLCSSYKTLHGTAFSEVERRRVTLFGILTPVGDDLFDIEKLDPGSISQIAYHPQTYTANSFLSAVAKEIQTTLIESVPNRQAYMEASKNVFEVQVDTIAQTDPSITDDAIERITYAKGGYSVIIYHQTLNEVADGALWEALFYVGSLMQLANDCFDIYKDIHDGIYTLASRCSDYRLLRQRYISRVKQTNRLIAALPYSKSQKQEFSVVMHAVISRGLIAINRMIRLQDQVGKPVDTLTLSRKQLICDMEKPRYIAEWLYYTLKMPFWK